LNCSFSAAAFSAAFFFSASIFSFNSSGEDAETSHLCSQECSTSWECSCLCSKLWEWFHSCLWAESQSNLCPQNGFDPLYLFSNKFFHHMLVSSLFSSFLFARRSLIHLCCSELISFFSRRFFNHWLLSFLAKRFCIQPAPAFMENNLCNQRLPPPQLM